MGKALSDYYEYSQNEHKFSTYYNRHKVLEAYTAIWKPKLVEEFNKTDVKDLVDGINGSLSFKKEVLKYIRQVFDEAMENRKASWNPAKKVKIHGDKSSMAAAKQLSAMTKSEIKTILEYFRQTNGDWYSIFYVTYQLGLRSGEAIGLKFEDINWESGQLTICRSWCKRLKGEVPPKNGTSRVVPVNDKLMEFLKNLYGVNRSAEYVLPRINLWLNGGASSILREAQDALGIQRTNYHSLRASFITHLLSDGLAVIKVQAMVGHRIIYDPTICAIMC